MKPMFRVLSEFARDERASEGGIIGVVIAIVLLLAVLVPVTQSMIATANLSGAASTVANILPLMEVVGGLLIIVSLFRRE